MKLAEALSVRADLQKKVARLEERLQAVAKVQEGDEPEESPEDLFAELQQAIGELENLVLKINLTNLHTVRDGESITRMIARKDALTLNVNTLRNVLKTAAGRETRYSHNEIKYVKVIDTARLRKKIDTLSAELRKVELRIQEINWTVELEETGD